MDQFVEQSRLLGTKPVVYNVCNFAKPAAGEPALLTSDDVTHHVPRIRTRPARHVLRIPNIPDCQGPRPRATSSSSPRSSTNIGRSTRRCFSITPSTTRPARPCPRSWWRRSRSRDTFNKGYDITELVAAAELDMKWHMLPASAPLQKPDTFEREALEQTHLGSAMFRRVIAPATSPTSGAADMRLATTPISGRRCSPTMPIRALSEQRWPDARQRRPLPPDGVVARQYRRPGADVRQLARRETHHRTHAEVSRSGTGDYFEIIAPTASSRLL